MPAYSIAIPVRICQQNLCSKRATREVCNTHNATLGFFCDKHAGDMVEKMNTR